MTKKARVLFARLSFDGHDRGVISVLAACRDAGMEAIYMHYNDPQEVARAAQEEDVDVVGLTSSMGEHFYVASGLLEALKERGLDTPVVVGGVIPTVDEVRLLRMGVKGVFGPGAAPGEAIRLISQLAAG
ncbi:MAG: cobalamin-dependent protein [Chloroflexota bacterium]